MKILKISNPTDSIITVEKYSINNIEYILQITKNTTLNTLSGKALKSEKSEYIVCFELLREFNKQNVIELLKNMKSCILQLNNLKRVIT